MGSRFGGLPKVPEMERCLGGKGEHIEWAMIPLRATVRLRWEEGALSAIAPAASGTVITVTRPFNHRASAQPCSQVSGRHLCPFHVHSVGHRVRNRE